MTNGRQLALSGHPVFDEKGAVAYVVIFIRDITAPSNLKKEIARQKELLATFQSMDKEENGGTPPVVESADTSRIEFNPIDLEGKTYKEIMRELEAVVFKAGMRRYGSIAEAAKHFQVDRSIMFRKVREHDAA